MKSRPERERWIAYRVPGRRVRLRLFCLPYAGGGASIYHTWHKMLPEEIEVCPVQLPGRETRLTEPLYTRLDELVSDLCSSLLHLMDVPFAFFGHSMGALVAFEWARRVRKETGREPVHLFVSGRNAPHVSRREKEVHKLPREEFVAELKRLGGTPQAVLENRELMDLLLPLLRADFALFETYRYVEEAPLRCPITAFAGTEDTEVRSGEIRAWQELTTGDFSVHFLPGDHFFIHQAAKEILAVVAGRLEPAWKRESGVWTG